MPGGINLTGVFLAATVAGVLLHVQAGRPLRFRLTHWDLWVALLALVVAAGATYGDPDFARVKAARFVVLVAVPYFLARVVLTETLQVRRFMVSVVAAILVVGGLAILSNIAPSVVPDVVERSIDPSGRTGFIEANPVPVGAAFLTALLILIAWSHRRPGRRALLGYAGTAIIFYGILLTGTRGAAVAAMLAMVVYAAILFRNTPRLTTIIMLAAIATVLVLPISAYRGLPNWKRFEDALTSAGQDATLTNRLERQREALAMFANDPAAGRGTGSVRSDYPHNIIIEVAAENGLIGLGPLFMMVVLVVGRIRRYLVPHDALSPEEARMAMAVLLPVVGMLVVKQFSFELTTHKDLFVFFALAVNLPYLLSRVSQESESRSDDADKSREPVPSRQPSPA